MHEFSRLFNRRSREAREIGQLAGHSAFGGVLQEAQKDVRETHKRLARIEEAIKHADHHNQGEHGKDRKAGRRGASNGQRSRRRD